MEAVVSTEFSHELPRIVTRAVAASVTRTLLQYQLRRRFGEFAGFLGLVYQLVGTQADTRIWSSLPGNSRSPGRDGYRVNASSCV